jgi:hypothetical protein
VDEGRIIATFYISANTKRLGSAMNPNSVPSLNSSVPFEEEEGLRVASYLVGDIINRVDK